MDQHPPQGGWKQQNHDDTAKVVLNFTMEEILMTVRKWLEMEEIPYQQDEQYSSQLSLPFDFKFNAINVIHHQMSQRLFLMK